MTVFWSIDRFEPYVGTEVPQTIVIARCAVWDAWLSIREQLFQLQHRPPEQTADSNLVSDLPPREMDQHFEGLWLDVNSSHC